MHPRDCPGFLYEQHPQRATLLSAATTQVVTDLGNRALDTERLSADSRPIHRQLFSNLTPDECPYYAGHYRGEAFPCLRYHHVAVDGRPIGFLPHKVPPAMSFGAVNIRDGIRAVDATHQDAAVLPRDKALAAVRLACHTFVFVLRVHPYVNGNGHTARFIVWAILSRYGYWLTAWPIEPRPPDPPYMDLVRAYRNGDHAPLETFILRAILGE